MSARRTRSILISALALLGVLAVPGFRWLFPSRHQHCIKQAIFVLAGYAAEHEGRYPTSAKGWGDALLELNETEDPEIWIQVFAGVDDDGGRFREALKSGVDVEEHQCTRVYVQGLTTESNRAIAILFDRDSEPGGDHFRSPFRKPLREVITVGGSHKMIEDPEWPEYVANQERLLRDEGFAEAAIQGLYGTTR